MRDGLFISFVVAASLATLSYSRATADEEIILHSDLPLELEHGQIEWPTECGDKTFIGHCSNFALGNWKWHDIGCKFCDDALVVLEIYSPIHGSYRFSDSDAKLGLHEPYDPAAIIQLTPASEAHGLYAVEIGFLGGSRLILLSANQGRDVIRKATVLSPRCMTGLPKVEWRAEKEPRRHIFLTDYCAVNSMQSLLMIARDALNRPPLATIEWVGPHSDDAGK